VDAGVMLHETPTAGVVGEGKAIDWVAADREEQQREDVCQGDSSGMSGISVNSSQTVSQPAAVWSGEILLIKLMPSNLLKLANAILPPGPVLDGLLKPS
jgi:hypothetical protein